MFDLENLGIWVGLIGGFSGFAALFLQGWSTYISTPRVSVKLASALNPNTGKKFLSMEVVNSGGKPITISNVGVRFKNGMHSPFGMFPQGERMGFEFPYRLESHSSQSWLVSEESTKLGIHDLKVEPQINAYIKLATGKEKVSEELNLNI
jgi:hypothetical protein